MPPAARAAGRIRKAENRKAKKGIFMAGAPIGFLRAAGFRVREQASSLRGRACQARQRSGSLPRECGRKKGASGTLFQTPKCSNVAAITVRAVRKVSG